MTFSLILVLELAQQQNKWKNPIGIAVESHNSALSCPTVLVYRNHLESIGIQQKLDSTMKAVQKNMKTYTYDDKYMRISHIKRVVEFYVVFKIYSIISE